MADNPPFDLHAAHQYFSAENFNQTWEFIQKNERTDEENLAMLHSAIASLWHWSQRADATPKNLSVSYWQVSRVFSLIGQPDHARRYGLLSLKHAETLEPFYKGYAYEALARAEALADNRVIVKYYLEKAREMEIQVADETERNLLAQDLETIQ